jgi:hypothetical protein
MYLVISLLGKLNLRPVVKLEYKYEKADNKLKKSPTLLICLENTLESGLRKIKEFRRIFRVRITVRLFIS